MGRKLLFLLSFLALNCVVLYSQDDEFLEKNNAFLFSPSYSLQVPAFDLSKRYGVNSNIGFSAGYKSFSNIVYEVEGNFIFGGVVKNDSLLDQIMTDGFLINANGVLVSPQLFERGFQVKAQVGKIFNFFTNKPSSGMLVKFGAGIMHTKIVFDINEDDTPQLNKEYKRGYDDLHAGLLLYQYIGLIRLEKEKFVNLSLGLDFTETFSTDQRSIDFQTNSTDNKTKFDLQIGLKLNWIIPSFRGEASKGFYYD